MLKLNKKIEKEKKVFTLEHGNRQVLAPYGVYARECMLSIADFTAILG